MHPSLALARGAVLGGLYRGLVRPIFFRIDPERVHDRVSGLGERLGRFGVTRGLTRAAFRYAHPMLEQDVLGIHFANPIGLSAGFDKDARLTDIWPAVGFGFAEVGSITGEPCAGNPGTRLWRLPHSKSLVVYYGLKNEGAVAIAKRLRAKTARRPFGIPIGMSVAKTNCRETCVDAVGIADYAKAFGVLEELGAYVTINISCPNAFGGEPFTDPARLEQLLSAIDSQPTTRPIFLKLSPDLTPQRVDELLGVAERHRVDGFICSNLTKNRTNPRLKDPTPKQGGMSGKVVEPLADKLIAHVYQRTRGRALVIGCGGVFSAEDAYKKIRLGASLIQLITGMIYQGPQLIGEINAGLVRLLKRDGFSRIGEVIGVDNPLRGALTTQNQLERADNDGGV